MRAVKTTPPAKSKAPPRRGGRAQGVGELVGAANGAALKRQGFTQSQIVGRWADIVGPEYAKCCTPDALRFPRGEKMGGTLTIACEGGMAAMLQHAEPLVVANCNRVFGYAAVSRVVLRHVGPREVPPAQPPVSSAPVPVAMSRDLRVVGDPALRSALESLARALCVSKGPPTFDGGGGSGA